MVPEACQGVVSQWIYPFAQRSLSIADRVKTAVIEWISPQQKVRQDSLLETIEYLSPNFQGFLSLQKWNLPSVFKIGNFERDAKQYIEALRGLKKLTGDVKEDLTADEKNSLVEFLKKRPLLPAQISRLRRLLIFKELPELEGTHFILQKLVQMKGDVYFITLQSKMTHVERFLGAEEADDEDEKLNLGDCSVIGSGPFMCDLIASLQKQGIPNLERLLQRWQLVANFNKSPSFSTLKQLCRESHPRGSVFLGSWSNYEFFFGRGYTCKRMAEQLMMGKWGHVGINVALEEGKRALSHVNGGTKNHAITPIRHELTMPFYQSLVLDISPLLPATVDKADHPALQSTFTEAFHKFALETHPEISIAGVKEKLEVVLFGHMTPRGKSLADIELPGSGARIHCSTYVAIIFLKAIREVNAALEARGIPERIAHPFGEHESIERLDVLRLIYLWNHLQVIKAAPIPPVIAKIMALPKPIDLSRR